MLGRKIFVFFCVFIIARSSVMAAAPDVRGTGEPVVAVVLAGGGALGFAHIGVLQVLEEEGIQADIVVGTSIGSIVGGLYAAGYYPGEIEKIVLETDWTKTLFDSAARNQLSYHWKYFQSQYPHNLVIEEKKRIADAGLSHAQHVVELLDRLFADYPVETDFDDLPRRYRAVAADLLTGERLVYDHGDLKTAIRASMAVPGVFTPVFYQGRHAIDGGWTDTLPTEVARAMGADIVIAVTLADMTDDLKNLSTIEAVNRQAGQMRIKDRMDRSLALADLVISPNLWGYTMADFEKNEELITLGYEAADVQRAAIRHAVQLQGFRDEPVIEESAPQQLLISSVTVDTDGDAEAARDLEEAISLSFDGNPTPEILREAIYRQYDSGDYNHVWYRLQPDVSGGFQLFVDAPIRERRSQIGLSMNGLFYLSDSLQTIPALGFGYRRYFGGTYSWGVSADAELSDFPILELKIFAHPLGFDTMVYSKIYIHQEPLYYFNNADIESLYSDGRYGAGFGLKVAFFRRFGITCGIFGELYHRCLRQGHSVFPDILRGRYGGSFLLDIDTLDQIIGPTKGLNVEYRIDSIVDTDGYWSVFVGGIFDGYFPFLSDGIIINPRFESHNLLAGNPDSVNLPALGTFFVPYGYFSQEIRDANLVMLGLRLRFKVASMPLGTGKSLYLQVAGNFAANWSGELGAFRNAESCGGGAVGVVADTLLGNIELSLCLNSDWRVTGLIEFTTSASFLNEP